MASRRAPNAGEEARGAKKQKEKRKEKTCDVEAGGRT
jgi:hypothetical protein